MLKIFNNDGKLRAELSDDYPFETPLTFEVRNGYTQEVIWEGELYKSCWSEYHYPSTIKATSRLINPSGVTLMTYDWNTMIDGNDIDKFFLTWSKNNIGSKGISIGTHDGMSGEWVEPVREGLLEAYLVEASTEQYKKLVNNYRNFSNAFPLMYLVTADGSEYDFFEGENGFTNSIIESITKKYQSSVTNKKMTSISLNNLILNLNLENQLDWLHLDTEGIDADLIMSLDENLVTLPKIIIFETINLSEEKRLDCINWLQSKGYNYIGPQGFNMMAFK